MKRSIRELKLKKIVKKRRIDEALSVLEEICLQQEFQILHNAPFNSLNLEQIETCIKYLQNTEQKLKNEIYTPYEAFERINQYIPKNKVVWEAFTRGNHEHIESPKYLRSLGHKVIATGEDFFTCSYGDCVVSNIPFSSKDGKIKQNILERLFYLKKPFMILIPLFFLQSKVFQEFYKSYGEDLQYIIPFHRIDFYKVIDNKKVNFEGRPNLVHSCFWLCWKIKLRKDVIFV